MLQTYCACLHVSRSAGPNVDSIGGGVLRDVIACLVTRRLSGVNSPLHEGHGGLKFWQPRALVSRLQPTEEQVEEAFIDGSVMGMQLLYCQSYPHEMSPLSLLVHLAGTTAAFTRDAAAEWMPELAEAIDSHRQGNIGRFVQLCQLYLNVPVC